MVFFLGIGLGVAGVFLLLVLGEVFYLVYWKKRPRAYPRPRGLVTVAPVNEGESSSISVGEGDLEGEAVGTAAFEGGEMEIDATCAHYQITALHQDLVAKLFPAAMMSSEESLSSPTMMMIIPPRSLWTIAEETREELDGLDMDFVRGHRSHRSSKSMSDISLSPVGPLSPISTPFITPLSSPDVFSTPYATPSCSPLVGQNNRSPLAAATASPAVLKTSCRIMCDFSSSSPPLAPPSPTRPTFPFLSRTPSPSKSVAADFPPAAFLVSEREDFAFNHVDLKAPSPLRSCTNVYENGTFSPCSPRSPSSPCSPSNQHSSSHDGDNFCSPELQSCHVEITPVRSDLQRQVEDHSCGVEITSVPDQQRKHSSGHEHLQDPNSPYSSSSSPSSRDLKTPPSETFVVSSPLPAPLGSSPSCKPSSQRSSSMLFSSSMKDSSFCSPFLPPIIANHRGASKSFLASGPLLSPPTGSTISDSTTTTLGELLASTKGMKSSSSR